MQKFRQHAVEIQRISGGWLQPCFTGERLLLRHGRCIWVGLMQRYDVELEIV